MPPSSTSIRPAALQAVERTVATTAGIFVAVGCEDASRADRNHFTRVIETARRGASRVRLADTVGDLDPELGAANGCRRSPQGAPIKSADTAPNWSSSKRAASMPRGSRRPSGPATNAPPP
ncbi:hypothetical protein [Mesorhizobium amorphae]|uniref:hypothetical protein n=1 Tax=Mesorhizobium amorphae TaxID=71433 RepID=UPI003D675C3C